MLGAMNFWMGMLVIYHNMNDSKQDEQVKTTLENEEKFYSDNKNNQGSSKNPKNKWKFNNNILQAFERAKNFIKSGKKVNSDIINELLGSSMTNKDLELLIQSTRYTFEDLTDHKKVISRIRALSKKNHTNSGVYI